MSALHLIETGADGNETGRSGAGNAIGCVTIRSLAQHMGKTIEGQFIVDQQAAIAEGMPHLRLRLADATGSVLAFVWPEYRSAVTLPALGCGSERAGGHVRLPGRAAAQGARSRSA